ncbi:LacI family transcriptional regulator [Herbiconiux sp. CPCC 205716]|uniref:LacI family transcriptional regulator n=1 Tax=Herbiconiux gentiana TaxID=2970912 RepID=A0ABT2GCK8_9MICO|nr:LacI family DNA-binding transcriptional regulator [Herbiconiux gentiana]MCS5713951.1 LacI family transcriptional regulator [Herbiconiux gentiana]
MPPRRPVQRATINDVARVAGVSRGTVSRVLNGETYVSDAARTAVEAAVAEVGYVRNAAARNLVTRQSGAIGLIVHEPHSLFLEDPNIGSILLGINAVLSEADYQLVSLVVDSDRDGVRVASYLTGGYVDGVVIISARENDPIGLAVARSGLPAAFVGHPMDIEGVPYVGIDNRSAARAVTERLMATGRQRIGMIAAGLDRDSGQDRLAGFTDALGDRFDPRLVVEVPLFAHSSGIAGMRELLTHDDRVDGVFASSDAIAAGALDAMRDVGLSAPGDIGVVGFDDSAWARRTQPPLSTVHQPADLLGRRAAELVLAQLEGRSVEAEGSFLETTIVWRDSA